MHEKFVSPSRSLSPSESIRRREMREAKANETRERILEEKAQKFKASAKKAEEIKATKEDKQQSILKSVESKLQRAEELKKQHIEKIRKKAHDEQSKVNEIQFINTLEAENKRHEILTREKDSEARLHDLQKERQRKNEEKAAKEAAVEERRKAAEAGRQARIEEMQEKRKQKDEKIERHMQNKEKERQEFASQKASEREQKLSAKNAAYQATVEALQKKIQQKLEESKRRHEENIAQIRQKAFELSICRCSAAATSNEDAPGSVPYETKKMCSLCKVFIGSEVYLYSHLRGKVHQDAIKVQHCGQTPSLEELECYNLKYIVDAPRIADSDFNPELERLDKERIKGVKKRCKKLKQKMLAKSIAFEANWKPMESEIITRKSKMIKCLKEVKKQLQIEKDTCISGPWPQKMILVLDRTLNEMERLLCTDGINVSVFEQNAFASCEGLKIMCELLNKIVETKKDKLCPIPNKTLIHLLLAENTPGVISSRKYDSVIAGISKHLACVINTVCYSSTAMVDRVEFNQRVQDVIRYANRIFQFSYY
ncbi:uncharacterized protein B4U80_00414 [Leptotrombidium deliense]|uniref:U1-type domain-containing protein n=1 Tax=Leptotrombidium deliense TaxID=299467 RepID=A0A443SRD4_9ACAR|nr:uncharacterized protein B4U80_00414 [Leptotrombidium deliense]